MSLESDRQFLIGGRYPPDPVTGLEQPVDFHGGNFPGQGNELADFDECLDHGYYPVDAVDGRHASHSNVLAAEAPGPSEPFQADSTRLELRESTLETDSLTANNGDGSKEAALANGNGEHGHEARPVTEKLGAEALLASTNGNGSHGASEAARTSTNSRAREEAPDYQPTKVGELSNVLSDDDERPVDNHSLPV
jgi:hypothetical protein